MERPDNSSAPTIPVDERVPRKTKVAWASGAFFENVMANGINALVLQIFNLGYGISPVLLGWAQMIPRFLDAFSDPFLGYLSDNTRSRFGRRRPWLLSAVIICTILFCIIWMPNPAWSTTTIFLWFLVISILYYQFFGMFAINFNALGMELTPNYNERTRVQAYRFFFIMLSTPLLGWAYKLSFMPMFTGSGPFPLDQPELAGVRNVALLMGGLMLISGLMPVIFCKEKAHVEAVTKVKLLEAFRLTFTNRPFVLLIIMALLVMLGALVAPFQMYVLIFYVSEGSREQGATLMGLNMTVGFICSFINIPLVTWVSEKIGKRGTLMVGQLAGIFLSVLGWWLHTPNYPYLFLVLTVLGGFSMGTIMILYNSIIADICDLDEIRSGQRREGMYGAVGGFVTKLAVSSTTVLTGYMLVLAGYNTGAAMQTPETITNMRLMMVFVPATLAAIGFCLTLYFPITRKRALQIRRVLERRRGKLMEVEF